MLRKRTGSSQVWKSSPLECAVPVRAQQTKHEASARIPVTTESQLWWCMPMSGEVEIIPGLIGSPAWLKQWVLGSVRGWGVVRSGGECLRLQQRQPNLLYAVIVPGQPGLHRKTLCQEKYKHGAWQKMSSVDLWWPHGLCIHTGTRMCTHISYSCFHVMRQVFTPIWS